MNNVRRVIIEQEDNRGKKIMIIFWLIVILPLAAYFGYKHFYKKQTLQEKALIPLIEQINQIKQKNIAGVSKTQESTSSAMEESQGDKSESESASDSEADKPESSTKETLDKTLLKIKILNGSGIPKDAGKTAEILEGKGYQNIETGDATRYDYKTTIIKIKKDKDDYYFLLTQDLKEKYNEFVKEELEEDSEFDVVIVIAK